MRKRVTGKKAVAHGNGFPDDCKYGRMRKQWSESSGSGNTSVKEDGSIDTSKHEVINMLVWETNRPMADWKPCWTN